MPSHVLFFVHGMGEFEPDWSTQLQAQLREHFRSYKRLREKGTDKNFDFVEINYNDVFEEERARWKSNADEAAKAAGKDGMEKDLIKSILDAAKAPTGDSFFQTHLLDVVLFYSFAQVSQRVQLRVADQILKRLRADGENNVPRWSVLAHSLGTAVTAETVHAMFTHKAGGVRLGDAFKPQYLAMVANCSRLLWNKGGDLYRSKARPEDMEGGGTCWKYLNFRHKLDPIPQVQPFHPPPAHWFPADTDPDRVYLDCELPAKDVASANVHSLEHYLSHPLVHIPLISTLIDQPDWISPAEQQDALLDWRTNKALKGKALKKAQDELDAMASDPDDPMAAAFSKWLLYRTSIGRKLRADGEN